MSKEKRVGKITTSTGICWGLICLIPFGWIFFIASIIRRKNDVIKYGTLNTRLALIVLHNYIISYTILFVFVMILCIDAWTKGRFVLPNLIAAIAIPIVYNVVVEKILNYEEKKQQGFVDEESNGGKLKRLTARKQKRKNNNNNTEDDNTKEQLSELKKYSRKLTSKIEHLEKVSKKRNG